MLACLFLFEELRVFQRRQIAVPHRERLLLESLHGDELDQAQKEIKGPTGFKQQSSVGVSLFPRENLGFSEVKHVTRQTMKGDDSHLT